MMKIPANSIKHNASLSEDDKLTEDKERKYDKILNEITSQIQKALILHKLKTGNYGNPDVAELSFNKNWEIKENKSKNAEKKGPIDILGHIEEINIFEIKEDLYKAIDKSKHIEENDKKRLKTGINNFIKKTFPRTDLESKERLPHKAFRIYYSKIAREQADLGKEGKNLYKNICLTLANLLFEKDNKHLKDWKKEHPKKEPPIFYNFVNKEGQITEKGLQYIGYVFLTTIENIPNTWDPKKFDKIFHDGDFNFLSKKDSAGNPLIGTLDLYVRAIIYLMTDGFNAYAEGGEAGDRERHIAKKAFLNKLYNTLQLDIKYNRPQEISDKGIIHNRLSDAWVCDENSTETNTDRRLNTRLKTESSTLLKIGGRTNDINDESGVRATYYGDMQDTEGITRFILDKNRDYFKKVLNISGLHIDQILLARKGDNFVTPDNEDIILKELNVIIPNSESEGQENKKRTIRKRPPHGQKKSQLSYISEKYKDKKGKKPSPGLQQAYNIASGGVVRGSNGDYTDFKLCIIFSYKADEYNKGVTSQKDRIQQDGTLKQEVSYYTIDNDLNMGNHGILDLEKRIFDQVQNVDAPDVKKSISLDKLRRFTEIAIKDISFEINDRNEQIKAGKLSKQKNDNYKYLCIGDKKVSLEGLIWRDQNNTDRFDTLILMILNYFITHNKILYLLPRNIWLKFTDDELQEEKYSYTSRRNFDMSNEIEKEIERRKNLRSKGQIDQDDTGISEEQLGLITKEQLHDKKALRERRFTTCDQVRKCALDFDFSKYCIGFYTKNNTRLYDNFYVKPLGELGQFIRLEKKH